MSIKIILKNLKDIAEICPIEKIQIYNSDLTVLVKFSVLLNVLLFLKNHILCQFKLLTCITAVDYPLNKYRFKLVYDLLSIKFNSRVKIKIFIHELIAIDSCEHLFLTSNWYECEIWDMFGIFFRSNTNLKRILTDYGFTGYPLRKDFPLSGFIEMKYHEIQKRVVAEPLELSQEYRTFKFLSPWQF